MVIDRAQLYSHLKKLKSLEEKDIKLEIKILLSIYGDAGFIRDSLNEAVKIRLKTITDRNPYLIGGTPLDEKMKYLSSAVLRCEMYRRIMEQLNQKRA